MNGIDQHEKNIKCIHENIEYGDDVELMECEGILRNFQLNEDKYIKNQYSGSAVAHAVKRQHEQFYELFVSKGLRLCPFEDMDQLVDGQPLQKRMKYRDINRKHFKDTHPKHILQLLSMSKLSHETLETERQEFSDCITKAFEELNSLKLIEPILKVVATDSKLKIVFDFIRNSVEGLDPTKHRGVQGTTYFENAYIYIGAKGLLENGKNRYQTLGTLIHEMCHYSMKLIYNNDCLPYITDNSEKINLFEEICSRVKTKKEYEKFIKYVYESPKTVHHSELIVRVPHLAALYKNDARSFKRVSETYEELFKFYKENTLIDLEQEYLLLRAKQKLIDLYDRLRVYQKMDIELTLEGLNIDLSMNNNLQSYLFILSNCPKLTINAIYQQFKLDIVRGSIIFVDSKTLQDEKIFDAAVKAINLCTKPKLIIDSGKLSVDAVKKIIKRFKEQQTNQRIVFVCDASRGSIDDPSIEVKYSWSHLTKTSQQKILQKKINFQGNETQLANLINDLSSIDTIPFNDFLQNQIISVAQVKVDKISDEIVKRKFLSLKSQKLNQRSENYDIEHDFNEMFKCAKTHQMILLSGEPGMGKSLIFKVIQTQLIKRYPTHWIVLMDLKRYYKVFTDDKDKEVDEYTIDLGNSKKVTNFLCYKVLKINGFEAQVFAHLFNDNRVIVLIDGFDEICPGLKYPALKFADAFHRHSTNQLWISTRPHLVKELKEMFQPLTFKLKPFTKKDRREFFEKAFTARDKKYQNIEQKIEEVENFLNMLRFNSRDNDSVSNPLLFRMIVECCNKDQSMKISSANLFSIYDQFTMTMAKICMEKGPEAQTSVARASGNSNIVKFYQQIAFRTCFDNADIKDSVAEIITLCFKFETVPTLDDILRVGILFSEDPDNFRLIHRSFAEFYVAKFLYEKIFLGEFLRNNMFKLITELFVTVLKNTEFKMIRTFLSYALDSFVPRENFEEMRSMLSNISMEINFEILHHLITEGHHNLTKTFIDHFAPKQRELLLMKNSKQENVIFFKPLELLLQRDQRKNMLLEWHSRDQNIFHSAAWNENEKFFCSLAIKIRDFTDRNFLAHFLMQSNKKGKTILMLAVNHQPPATNGSILSTLIEYLNSDQIRTIFQKQDQEGQNIFQLAISNDDSEVFSFLVKKVEKLTDHSYLTRLLIQSNKTGIDIIMRAVHSESIAVNQRLFVTIGELLNLDQLRGLMLEREKAEPNVFHIAAKNHDSRVLCFAVKIVNELTDRIFVTNLIRQSDVTGMILLMKSLENQSLAFNKRLFVTIAEFLDSDQFRELLLERGKAEQNVFHMAAKNRHPEVLSSAVKKVCELIMTSLASNKRVFIKIGKFLDSSQLRQMLLEQDKNERNLFHFAAKNRHPEVLSFAMKKVNERTDCNIVTNLLMQRNISGKSTIMTSNKH